MKAVAYLLTALLGLLLLATPTSAQRDDKRDRTLYGSNSEGTHFIVGFMQNETNLPNCNYYGQRQIMLASRFNVRVTVRDNIGRPLFQGRLRPFEVRAVEVDQWYECMGEGVFDNALDITADAPISVYCFNSKVTTTEGYLALPVNSWGTEYVTSCYAVDHYDTLWGRRDPGYECLADPRGGEIAVIASEDNTRVTIYPNARTLTGVPVGGIASATIHRGQIYQIQDGGRRRGATDLTGSIVVADKPVGILSGHIRAAVNTTYNTKDHLIEMIPPRNTLGMRHFAVPFGGRQGGDEIRVIGSMPGPTQVTFVSETGSSTATIAGAGRWVSYDLRSVTTITTTQPVLVTHYSRSTMSDPRNAGRQDPVVKFDPYMIVLTPEEQFVNAAVFQTLPNYSTSPSYPDTGMQFERHYTAIVGEAATFSTITLNGQPIWAQAEYQSGVIGGTGYMWASFRVADGSIHVLNGEGLFGGYVYGLGHYDSYGWPVGAGLRKFDVVDGSRPVLSALRDCYGYEIIARDSGALETGLRNAWIDTASSTNMTFEREIVIRGDEYSLGHLFLIDPTRPGRATVIAEDLAGNRDTITVIFVTTPPQFDRDSVHLFDVRLNDSIGTPVSLMNVSPDSMPFITARLAVGTAFHLDQTYTTGVIAPGSGRNFPVYFRTDVSGIYRDTLIIECNCQIYRIPLLAVMGVPRIATHDLDFGTLRRGSDSCMTLHVSNTGDASLRIDSAVIEGEGFRITLDLPYPIFLAPGEDTTLTVCFLPPQVGTFTGTVSFHSNADSVAVSHLIGRAVYPNLTIGSYDYGRMQVGDSGCTLIPIANVGSDDATLTGLLLDDGIIFHADTVGLFPRTLRPGDTLWVRICFRPGAERDYTSGISPRNIDGLETFGSLLGSGYQLLASIDGYDWGNRWVGTINDTVVYVHNRSNSPLDIARVWTDSGDTDVLTITAAPWVPGVIAANDSMPVDVRFAPLVRGGRMCRIHASTSSRQTPVVSNTLRGFALHAAAVDSLTMATDIGWRCAVRNGTLAMVNTGNVPLTIAEIATTSTPQGSVTMTGIAAGDVMGPGEGLVATLTASRGDMISAAEVVWRYAELPDTHRRTVVLPAGLPQTHAVSMSSPASVGVGGGFDITAQVDSARWPDVNEEAIALHIHYNPALSAFDLPRWRKRIDSLNRSGAPWRIEGEPTVVEMGHLRIDMRATPAAPILAMTLPAFPFRAYLGASRTDTVRLQLLPADTSCVLPSGAAIVYNVDSICGLTIRLFEYTGPPYALRPISPNPASGVATLDFTLGLEAETRIELLTAEGALAAMLLNGVLPAGNHTLPIDLRTLGSGVYHLRITSGPFAGSQRLVVVE